MKVFISWSGPRAKAPGAFMKEWLGDVIQALDPWVSSEDLRKGQAWFPGIGNELREMAAAIVIVTPENMHEDWLLFEAGAAFGPGHPCFTYLLDLEPSDLTGPLVNLNHTRAEEDDTLRMVRDINDELGDGRRKDKALDRQFETWWPKLKSKLEEIREMPSAPPKATKRDTHDMIVEMLDMMRRQDRDRAVLGGVAKILSAESSGSGMASVYAAQQASRDPAEGSPWQPKEIKAARGDEARADEPDRVESDRAKADEPNDE